MIIKVCGLRESENIRAVEASGATAFGFIFYPRSPRFVARRPDYLPHQGKCVGVFVSPEERELRDKIADFGLSAVQLYGEVPLSLAQRLRAEGTKVWRAIPASSRLNEDAAPWADACDLFLFDTPSAGFGGSGRSYDWNCLAAYSLSAPFILSGGLNPASLPALSVFSHPRWKGIDLNSGFELRPGYKDAALLTGFIDKFKQQHSNESH